MPEWDQLIKHEADPSVPAPTLDQLFHRTRASERRERVAWGIVGALVVVTVVLLGIVAFGATTYSHLVTKYDRTTQVQTERALIRECKDTAFAITADVGFTTGDYPPGYLIKEYNACQANPHHAPQRP